MVLALPALAAAVKNMAVVIRSEEVVALTSSKHKAICFDIDTREVLRTNPADLTGQFVHPYRPQIKSTSPRTRQMKFEAAVWRSSQHQNEDIRVQKLIASIPPDDASEESWVIWNADRNELYGSCVSTVVTAEKRLNRVKKVERNLPHDGAVFTLSILKEQRYHFNSSFELGIGRNQGTSS